MKNIQLKEGDLFYFGMLMQVWLVKKVKGKLRAVIVSLDSGWGYWEELEDMDENIQFEENGFELLGNIKTYNRGQN